MRSLITDDVLVIKKGNVLKFLSNFDFKDGFVRLYSKYSRINNNDKRFDCNSYFKCALFFYYFLAY